MPENILVCAAWPYANGSIHLGHVAGCYLPADIFARYHRIKGDNVLMVSGSDAHGTPVTISAETKGIKPEDIVSEYQDEYLSDWEKLGISFDLFTSTHTENHTKIAQEIFISLLDDGYIYKDIMSQPFCEAHGRFLADRYVEGICPHCNFNGARGDQCDGCGNTLDPKDLIDIKHRDCEARPIFRDTEHFFLKLTAFESDLLNWVNSQTHWKPNVKNFTTGFLENGLKDRAITRDISWGVPVPLDGYKSKRIYVWFEAVIGYLSASIEWASNTDDPDSWNKFWKDGSKSYYFMGKDNIPFHSVIWPAMIMGYKNINLPFDIPANEYVNMESQKISTSRNWVINLKDAIEKYDPDSLRFTLSAIMPETSDSNFTWSEFVRRNNDELVATFGNLVNRVLSMISRNYDGQIPSPTNLGSSEQNLFENAHITMEKVSVSIESCKFREGLGHAMSLAQLTNRYLDDKAPWAEVKIDKESAGTTLYTAINIINCLKVLFHPYLPFSTSKLHNMLGNTNQKEQIKWEWNSDDLQPGTRLGSVERLFTKLDDNVVDEEETILGKRSS